MRAMTSPPAVAPPHRPLFAASAAKPWQIALLWAGLPLCLFGIFWNKLWQQWPSGRFAELLILALLAWALAWPLRRFARWSWASALAIVWCAALALFAGPLPVAATALLALTACALGGTIARRESAALQTACGLALLGGALGWLLPLPLHTRWAYLLVCLALVTLRRRVLTDSLRHERECWRAAVSAAPKTAAFAVVALGLASIGCWLPTLQVDDVGYHLRLPWQLLEQARYVPDPETHIWALAPWLGDVLQAFPQLIAGAEARGALNALWMLLTACGVWRLAATLGGEARAGWLSVALYASLPLTAVLNGSMQTEAPTAALLVWLVTLIARAPDPRTRASFSGALLVGGLLGLKLAAALFAVLLLPWALWRHRPSLRAAHALIATAAAVALGGSSYAYAFFIAGNPFLPLFNGWFRSPFFATSDFDDARWHAGFDWRLPWDLTFDTGRYLEAFAGGGGFVLIALSGVWLLALTARRTAVAAAMLTVLIAVPLLPMQYLRYVFPAIVALLPLLAVVALRHDPRRAAWLLIGVCVLNFAFQANGHWMLRTGALKQTVLALGDDAPLFAHYAPERLLLKQLRAARDSRGNVLSLDPAHPVSAELGSRGRVTSHYDPSLHRAASAADADPSGAAWETLLRRERIGQILLRPKSLTPAQRAGLQRVRARQRAEVAEAQWWSVPAASDGP
jgi:hypothetical protein